MDRKEAIRYLADGHTVWKPELANKVCDAFGVERIKPNVFRSDPPGTIKGLTMKDGEEGALGVDGLTLSRYVAGKLGLKVRNYIGRGFQAQAYAQAIAEYVKEQE